jgi:hypothetical protein
MIEKRSMWPACPLAIAVVIALSSSAVHAAPRRPAARPAPKPDLTAAQGWYTCREPSAGKRLVPWSQHLAVRGTSAAFHTSTNSTPNGTLKAKSLSFSWPHSVGTNAACTNAKGTGTIQTSAQTTLTLKITSTCDNHPYSVSVVCVRAAGPLPDIRSTGTSAAPAAQSDPGEPAPQAEPEAASPPPAAEPPAAAEPAAPACKPLGAHVLGASECCSLKTRSKSSSGSFGGWVCCDGGDGCT